jgi:hypothetical protein
MVCLLRFATDPVGEPADRQEGVETDRRPLGASRFEVNQTGINT